MGNWGLLVVERTALPFSFIKRRWLWSGDSKDSLVGITCPDLIPLLAETTGTNALRSMTVNPTMAENDNFLVPLDLAEDD
jgi:hypothetical protein